MPPPRKYGGALLERFNGIVNLEAATKSLATHQLLYNICSFNARAQRCKESAFVGKESRFFAMVFFSASFSLTMSFFKASKFDKPIRGGERPSPS